METMLDVIEMPIDSIIPYDKNPRLNEDAVDKVADSISNYGWRQPIVVDSNNVIICGHTRMLAAIKLGLSTVPVHVAKNLSPDKVKAYRLDDNKTAELATWDFAKLQEELVELKDSGYDMDTLAFSEDEMTRLLEDNSADSENSEEFDSDESDSGIEIPNQEGDDPNAVYDSEKGGIYQLGKHRLVCGDCTEGLDIARLFDGDGAEPVSLWLTDPPYNVNYVGHSGMHRVANGLSAAVRNQSMKLANDNMSEDEFEKFISRAFKNCMAYLAKGASYYVFHSNTVAHIFRNHLVENDANVSNQLIWAKNHFALGWGCYLMKHEPIWFGWKKGAPHKWYGEHNNKTTTIQKWDIVHNSNLHPSMKPVPMLEYFIRNSSSEGEIVMDTFGGSGSTMIACEHTGRVCRMMELMPKYADAIRKRWAEEVHGEGCDWVKLTPKIGNVVVNEK